MSKTKVLRTDQPHQVQMPEGSKTASRKTVRKTDEPAIEERPVPARRIKTPEPEKTVPAAPAISAPAAASARSKARLDNNSRPAVRKTEKAAPAPLATRPVLQTPPAESLLWETPSPVMERLQQLRERNTQIAEQIQRLTQNLPTRGRAS